MSHCTQHATEHSTLLRAHKLKATPTRLLLLDVFAHTDAPLAIDEVAKKLVRQTIDTVTIYRNVQALVDLGVLAQVRLHSRRASYELATQAHHHHIVCEQCGKIVDVSGCNSTAFEHAVMRQSGFTKINQHSFEFFGVCATCSR